MVCYEVTDEDTHRKQVVQRSQCIRNVRNILVVVVGNRSARKQEETRLGGGGRDGGKRAYE